VCLFLFLCVLRSLQPQHVPVSHVIAARMRRPHYRLTGAVVASGGSVSLVHVPVVSVVADPYDDAEDVVLGVDVYEQTAIAAALGAVVRGEDAVAAVAATGT
jgi:hypothetical protein